MAILVVGDVVVVVVAVVVVLPIVKTDAVEDLTKVVVVGEVRTLGTRVEA